MNFSLAVKNNLHTSELIDVFIKGDIPTIEQLTSSVNGKMKYFAGDIAAVKIPVSALSVFAGNTNIKRIEAYPPHFKPMNDTMLLNNNVIPVHAGQAPLTQGYNGSGIVMGIIDTGIDFNHPDFRDSLGNTRVKFLWDQTQAIAANTPSYGYGQEWNNTEIDGGLASAHNDIAWNGHGTHVSGIAAGNGLASGTYKGVAPKSDIVFVAFDFYGSNATGMTDAVDYIYSKANSLGKPCVINASLGDYYGSHDGLDLQAQLIKNMITAQPGRAFVAAAGNAGDIPFHLGYTVSADTNFTFFNSGGNIYLEMWADTNDLKNVDFSIGADKMSPFHSYRGNILFSDIASNLGILKADTLYKSGNRIGIIQSYGDLVGGTYSMQFKIIPDSIAYNWRLITTGTGKFNLWNFDVVNTGLPSAASMPDSIYYKLPDLNQTMVSSFQCLDNVITVGNYTNRKSVTNYNNMLYVDNLRIPGKRHPNSSSGPTRDGRTKPDIAAPGDFIMSCSILANLPADAIAYPDYYDPGGYHTRGGGTSAASPGVAGIAALYLQKNPGATAMDVKNAIINCTTIDAYTGTVPNNQYGYGKANAFNALTGCLTTQLNNNTAASSFLIYPNPSLAAGSITIDFFNIQKNAKTDLLVYNGIGQLISTHHINDSSIELNKLSAGIYFCKLVQDERIVATEKMIILQ
ncbi:MAG TPA: S8 family serine peptidase [Bacteroidia bacterium]